MNSIEPENLLNLILVRENVRHAFLLQPIDYNETTGNDPKMSSILFEIKKQFPDLIHSDNYETYQGTIISKISYNGQTNIDLNKMGEILGYPCYEGFVEITPDDETYTISVIVYIQIQNIKNDNSLLEMQNELENNQYLPLLPLLPIELFVNKCKDTSKIQLFNDFIEKAKHVFEKEKYKQMFSQECGFIIDKIKLNVEKNITIQCLINKLVANDTLDKNEKNEILNILYNLSFSNEFQDYFEDNFQYYNSIHIGILLGLLLYFKNDPLLAFVPLQKYPTQNKMVIQITKEWETDLMTLLNNTKQK
jgi:hypothetical protein